MKDKLTEENLKACLLRIKNILQEGYDNPDIRSRRYRERLQNGINLIEGELLEDIKAWNTRPSPLPWRKPEEGLMALRDSGETFLMAFQYSSDEEATIYYKTATWFSDFEVQTDSGTLFNYTEIIAYMRIPTLKNF